MTQNDVLVVGAGPSGLFAACELARHGIKVRLVERELGRHREARATAIQPGTLEILDSVGLLSPFLETAEHVRCTRLYRADLSEFSAATFEGVDCRCEFLCSLPQYETERILEAHLASLGGAVERGITVTKLDLDANGVLAELVHGESGIETVHADGRWSTITRKAGLAWRSRIPGSATQIGHGSAGRLITCLFLDSSRTPRGWQGWAAGGQSAWRSLTIPMSGPCAPASERAAWY